MYEQPNRRVASDHFGSTPAPNQKLTTLVKSLTTVAPQLIRDEIQLAKAELKDTGKKAGVGAGLFGGAGLLGFFGLIALLIAAIFGLSQVLPNWLAALIVAAAFFLIAGIAALIGKKSIDKAFEDSPAEAIDGVKYDMKVLTQGSSATPPSKEVVKYEPQEAKKKDDASSLSVPELRARIDRRRDELGDTVDRLGYKLDVPSRAKEFASETSATVTRFVREKTEDLPERLEDLKEQGGEVVQERWKPLTGLAASLVSLGVLVKKYKK